MRSDCYTSHLSRGWFHGLHTRLRDTAVVRLVGDQLVRSLDLNVVAVAGELSHHVGTPPDNARPAGEVVEDLVDDVIRDDI